MNCVAVAPDGRLVASGSMDQTIRIWELASGDEVACHRGNENLVHSLSFTPDGNRLIAGGFDSAVRIWDVRAAAVGILRGGENTQPIVPIAGGTVVINGTRDKGLRAWDVESGREIGRVAEHVGGLRCVAATKDGSRIVAASNRVDDDSLFVWDLPNETPRVLARHTGARRVVVSPDGARIAATFDDATLQVWNAETGEALLCERRESDPAAALAFIADGESLVCGFRDGRVSVLRLPNGTPVWSATGHSTSVAGVASSQDGERIASAADGTIRIWNAWTGACERAFPGGPDPSDYVEAGRPWRFLPQTRESAIESASSGEVAGWFPANLSDLVALGDDGTWAGLLSQERHLCLLRLEGARE